MELGGKASAIVMKDADLSNAAQQCALGAFLNVSALFNRSCEQLNVTNAVEIGWSNLHVYRTNSSPLVRGRCVQVRVQTSHQ